jgi:60 kDa SS-A/Ro ribonucleoprotein
MANRYASHLNVRKTPQSEPIPGKAMVENAAGGFVFEIDDWDRLRRFLILGTEGGTYYAKERALTLENCECLLRCLAADPTKCISLIAYVSQAGLAPKNDAAVFALAVCSVKGNDQARAHALRMLPAVCRIGTHLFQFAEAREALGGGWGRGAKRAVANWYDREDLVLQLLKYQQRNGWSHRDLLRLAHPKVHGSGGSFSRNVLDADMNLITHPADVIKHQRSAAFDAACAPDGGERTGPSKKVAAFGSGGKVNEKVVRGTGLGWAGVDHPLAQGYVALRNIGTNEIMAAGNLKNLVGKIAQIVADHKLPRELVPTEYLNVPVVQEAMLPHLGLTALIRNLGNMSKSGFLKPLSQAETDVCARLADREALRRSRVHPWAILLASRVYASGKSDKGSGAWKVCDRVVDALDAAFYQAFENVVPTGKRHLLAIDTSGSMSWDNDTPIMCAEAAAAMALATAKVESVYKIVGFSTGVREIGITARDGLTSAMGKVMPGGGTNVAASIQWAIDEKIGVDAFVVYTDNETWAGNEHTCQALQRYRRETGIKARLAVVAFAATGRTVTDPTDPGSMDFVGMDASLPQALAAFVGEG